VLIVDVPKVVPNFSCSKDAHFLDKNQDVMDLVIGIERLEIDLGKAQQKLLESKGVFFGLLEGLVH